MKVLIIEDELPTARQHWVKPYEGNINIGQSPMKLKRPKTYSV